MRVVVIAVMLAGAVAFAAPPKGSPEARKQAESHFKQGKAFLDTKLYDEALRELAVAYDLFPLPVMLFDMAQAYRLKGDPATALDMYKKFVDASPDDPAADEARLHIAELTKVKDEQDAAAARIKAEQDAAAAAAEAKRQADAQAAAAAAAEAERQRAEAERQRAEAERMRIEAEARAREEHKRQVEAARIAQAQAEQARAAAAWEAERAKRRKTRNTGYGLAGTGVGLGAMAIIFAELGSSTNSQIQKGGLATASRISSLESTGQTDNDLAEVSAVLAVVGIAIGVPLIVTHLDRGELHVTATAAGGPGISLGGSF